MQNYESYGDDVLRIAVIDFPNVEQLGVLRLKRVFFQFKPRDSSV